MCYCVGNEILINHKLCNCIFFLFMLELNEVRLINQTISVNLKVLVSQIIKS